MQQEGSEKYYKEGVLDRLLGAEDEESQSLLDSLRTKKAGGNLLSLLKPPEAFKRFLGRQTVGDLSTS